jgi:hypothetical protein
MELVDRSVGRSVFRSVSQLHYPVSSVRPKKITLNYRYVQHGNKDTSHQSCNKIKLTSKIKQYFSKGRNFENLTNVFCNIASCKLLNIHRRFGEASSLYI